MKMNIYRVKSKWSEDLISANNVSNAEKKYEKLYAKISKEDRVIKSIENLGPLSA